MTIFSLALFESQEFERIFRFEARNSRDRSQVHIGIARTAKKRRSGVIFCSMLLFFHCLLNTERKNVQGVAAIVFFPIIREGVGGGGGKIAAHEPSRWEVLSRYGHVI